MVIIGLIEGEKNANYFYQEYKKSAKVFPYENEYYITKKNFCPVFNVNFFAALTYALLFNTTLFAKIRIKEMGGMELFYPGMAKYFQACLKLGEEIQNVLKNTTAKQTIAKHLNVASNDLLVCITKFLCKGRFIFFKKTIYTILMK